MSAEQDAPETVFDAVGDMEAGITQVESWAKAFQAVATSNERIDPDAIFVMANALEELGERLKLRFHHAREMAHRLEPCRTRNP